MKKTASLALALLATTCLTSQAAVLINETFSYPDGNLAGNGGWLAHSGAGATPVQVVSSTVVLNQGSGSREDVNVPLGVTMGAGDVFYASFDFTVSSGSTDVYFAHFKNTTTGFGSRVFVTAAPGGAGDYGIGIGEAALTVTFPTALDFGTTYKAVIAYSYDSRTSQLWIDPTSAASTSVTSTAATGDLFVSSFGLRQAGGNSTQIIDNLIVATTLNEVIPEPTTTLLGLIGAVALIRRRR